MWCHEKNRKAPPKLLKTIANSKKVILLALKMGLSSYESICLEVVIFLYIDAH